MTVIALIIIGTLLIVLNVNAIKKEKRSFSSTLKNEEESITEYQIELGKMRREFSETVLELQKEIEGLKSKEETNSTDKKDSQEDIEKGENNSLNIRDRFENNSLDINDNLGNKELIELIHKDLEIIDKNNDENVHYKLNNQEESYENNKGNSFKVNEIKSLLDEGLSIEEIAEKIGIGKGEVLLIKDLYVK